MVISRCCLLSFALVSVAIWANAGGHWAYQPLGTAAPPVVKDESWPRQPLDRFVLAGWEKQNLRPAASADKRSLLRRVTYDLTGLPPTVEEMDAFLADSSPDALSQVFERLLASSAYGEKWGRFWLDVVRYADTAGENTDRPLPDAWRYRNWVISAFNQDLPYDEFIRWQVAGDILAASAGPDRASDMVIATGGIAVARRFGHDAEKDMHLTYEDVIDTLGKSFLGLTLGCARCHDHKYDPVSMRDYYGLYGIFQSSRFPFTGCEAKPRPKDSVPLSTPEFHQRMASWEQEFQRSEQAVTQAQAVATERQKALVNEEPKVLASGELTPGGAQEMPLQRLILKRGEMLQLSVLPRGNYGADSTGVEWEISQAGPEAKSWNLARDFLADPAQERPSPWRIFDLVSGPAPLTEFVRNAEKTPGLLVWRGAEACPSLFLNAKDEIIHFLTVTMPPKSAGLHPGPQGGVAAAWECPAEGEYSVQGKVSEFDPGGDGIAWKLERRSLSLAPFLDRQREGIRRVATAKKTRDEISARKPVSDFALALAEATPLNARIQRKGEPKDPGEEVPRKMLDLFGGGEIPTGVGSGRRELADWLTRGPVKFLTARVMVNRLWHWHFGEGIVGTPNDFGIRGQPPSDLPLLDFLAGKFIEGGWSIKSMHRLILASAVWQRTSATMEGTVAFPRRRLTAEELRDTLLAVSGNLDRTPGAAHPFPADSTWTFTQHNPFAAVYDNNRRSVYQMVQRTRQHPFLSLFDGADPNASTPCRSQSTVPTQALYFLNDPFVHQQAKALALRLVQQSADEATRLDIATRMLFGRAAGEEDRAVMTAFFSATSPSIPSLTEPERSQELWAGWLRILFGTNELLYVD